MSCSFSVTTSNDSFISPSSYCLVKHVIQIRKTFYVSVLWRTIMVQMFMRDLKKVSALWSVRFRVSALERFCYKGFLRNSSGTNFFVRLREVSALEDIRLREVPLYFLPVCVSWDKKCVFHKNFDYVLGG